MQVGRLVEADRLVEVGVDRMVEGGKRSKQADSRACYASVEDSIFLEEHMNGHHRMCPGHGPDNIIAYRAISVGGRRENGIDDLKATLHILPGSRPLIISVTKLDASCKGWQIPHFQSEIYSRLTYARRYQIG